MKLADLSVEHALGAVGAYLLGAGVWNLNRTLFPETPEVVVTAGLLVVGALLVEQVLG